jgi:DNA adenine methylase
MTGAGPIGGYEQKGKWQLGVRFVREALAERILALSRLRGRVHVSQLDALDFLKARLPRGGTRSQLFVYLDPPYVNNGQRLYMNSYGARDHTALARYVLGQKRLHWLISYDDTDLVRSLYIGQQLANLPIRYSLQKKRDARELIIAPPRLTLPVRSHVHGRIVTPKLERYFYERNE